MTNFTFTTREEYLAYRADWRARYKAQSEKIRAVKRQLASLKGQDTSYVQSSLYLLRRTANEMMVELTEAKEFKNAQLAARQAEAA